MPGISNFLADKQWFIVFLVFVAAVLVQLIYYVGFYMRLVFYKNKSIYIKKKF